MSRTRVGMMGLVVAGLVSVALLVLVVVPAGDEDPPDLIAPPGEDTQDLAAPSGEGHVDFSIYSLPLEELVEQSDIVVIGRVIERKEDVRQNAGHPDVTSVHAAYTVEAEHYIRGAGARALDLRVGLALEFAPEGLDPVLTTTGRDDPFTVGDRYVLALRSPDGAGYWGGTAEPFAFRDEDGMAIPEYVTPGSDGDPYLAQQFPSRSLDDLVAHVESLADR